MTNIPTNIQVKCGSDGIWFARPYLGINAVTGAPLRPYKSFPEATNEHEAIIAANEWFKTIIPAGAYGVAMKLTDVLDRYIVALELLGHAPNTLKTYRSLASCHIAPSIGSLSPDEIRPHTISLLYAQMMTPPPPKKPVCRNTVRKMHGFLTGAFKWMRKEGFIDQDPMLYVTAPVKDKHEAVAIMGDDLERLTAALEEYLSDDSLAPKNIINRNCAFAAWTSFMSGLREGEVCALIRKDANSASGFLHICANASEDNHGHVTRRLKTKGKVSRNVSMPDTYFTALDAHYKWQQGYIATTSTSGLTVCTGMDGAILAPSKLSRWFSGLRYELGLAREIKYHSLRHTHASILLYKGFDLKTIAERLGHARETLTLETYSHVMPGRDQAAAEVFNSFTGDLRGGGP